MEVGGQKSEGRWEAAVEGGRRKSDGEAGGLVGPHPPSPSRAEYSGAGWGAYVSGLR